MTHIELRFLASRYHGTAWGRHVNEGAAEWPPSPYRLFRAIYDAWKRKCNDLHEHQVIDVLSALAVKPPTFWLPRVVASHTRSYLSSNTEDRADKSLIFDGFVALNPKASCFLQWDVSLSPDQRRTLDYLLSSLNYLGRSESWVEACLGHGRDDGFEFVPGPATSSWKDVTYVACAVPLAEYKADVPWLDALTYSTNKISKERLSGPPAMRYVPYSFDPRAVTTWLPSQAHTGSRKASAAVVELHAKVLPMITDSVRVAERVRGRLMRCFESKIPSMIHGKDQSGTPLRDHSHLFILPRPNRFGRIDHVLIYTRNEDGFDAGVADAIANIRQVRWIEPMRAVSAWMGSVLDDRIRPGVRVVRSSTPFVTTRHWRRGRGSELEFLKEEVRRECANHGLSEPAIEVIEQIGTLAVPKFRRNREGDPSRKGMAFRLHFEKEVRAPFSLGYGCHFGLGQFENDESSGTIYESRR